MDVEDGFFQIFIQRHLATLERGNYHLMPRLKFRLVQMKVVERPGAFRVIPGIAKKDSAYIPKNRPNSIHSNSPLKNLSFLPSQPALK
jgi:hypothetical protein